jgi:hypothetical protein
LQGGLHDVLVSEDIGVKSEKHGTRSAFLILSDSKKVLLRYKSKRYYYTTVLGSKNYGRKRAGMKGSWYRLGSKEELKLPNSLSLSLSSCCSHFGA